MLLEIVLDPERKDGYTLDMVSKLQLDEFLLISFAFFASMVGILFHDAYFGTPLPPHIVVRPLTVDDLKELQRQELLAKRYARAAQIARSIFRLNGCKRDYSALTGKAAVDMDISPRLLAGLIYVESSCNPLAESPTRDIGLMQIHYPLYRAHTRQEYFDPAVNIATGCPILKGYIKQYGLQEGLHAYNGFGDKTTRYADKVLAAARM